MKAPHMGRAACAVPQRKTSRVAFDPGSPKALISENASGPATAKENGKRRKELFGSLKSWVRSQHDELFQIDTDGGGDCAAPRRGSETSQASTAVDDASWEAGIRASGYFFDPNASSGTTAPDRNTSSGTSAPATTEPARAGRERTVVMGREGPGVPKVDSRLLEAEDVPPDGVVFFEDAVGEGLGLPPRTASEVSKYWKGVQAHLTAERESMGFNESPPTSFGRPVTCIDEVQADGVKTKVLEVKNSQLQDRVAELERQLAAMAAAQPASGN